MMWQQVACLEERLCLTLPEDWTKAAKEVAVKKFPYRKKPQEIFTNSDASQILTLDLVEQHLVQNEVYPAIWEMQRLISHMYPESIKETSQQLNLRVGKVGYFSFVTGGIKCDSCHYMFVMEIGGKMVMGSYHSSESIMKESRTFIMEVLRNMQLSQNFREI